MKRSQVLVSGSLAYDRIMNFGGVFSDHILPEKIHTLSVSFTVDKLAEHFGGTAGNIAYTLRLLGRQPVVVASAGVDFAHYRERFESLGIERRGVRVSKKDRTATAWIMTDSRDNQISAFHPGALSLPATEQSWWRRQSYVYAIAAAGTSADRRAVIHFARQKGIPFAFDPGQRLSILRRDEILDSIRGAHALFVNDYELALLMKHTGLSHAALRAKVSILVTTLGSKGSRIECGGKTLLIPPAKPKAIIDPTGAGDAYRSGFIHGFLAGWELAVVGRFAGLVSVYTVEKLGTQTHTFTWKDLRMRYKQNFGNYLP